MKTHKIRKSVKSSYPIESALQTVAGWEVKTLGDLFEITSSRRVFEADWKKTGIPFYRAREIVKLAKQGFVDNELFISTEMYNQYSKKYGIPQEGDIMVTGVGTLGICYVVQRDDKFYFKDGNIIWLKNTSGVDSRFVEYAFKSDILRKQIDNSIGATVGTFTIIKAKNTLIPIPPLPEQKRIVAILDEAFTAIAKAKENAEKNLRNAKELFESYLQGVFANPGEGWEEKKLGEVVTFSSGGTPSKSNHEFWQGDVPWVSGKDMKSDRINDSILHISQRAISQTAARVAPIGSLLILVRGMGLANGIPIAELMAPCAFNQDIKAMQVNSGIQPRYLLLALQAQFKNHNQMTDMAAHGTLKIEMENLKEVPIPLAPSHLQTEIVYRIEMLRSMSRRLEVIYQQKLADLEELKKSILQKAFRGELTAR
ncbi:restriction endonuclease subunit S [Turneriella parva]|uniref:Restriction modification system DNA specificity domain-containing protein n=1 Tax=Turneriella parva (strain ATCC BAA-1111 / DSM 21527 / NCTC 11395 / H) TaxID=869212 RepID=I4B1R1_TURPD|nr:restriction endonuclease subunit S [Turneriella parva]AFM11218.1 restriction modification system DNA specificity domain-containing protein [Turneriella parva DSM 21527]